MSALRDGLSLDALGVLHATDKSVLAHGYLRHYDRAFGPMRDLPINFIEIGVAQGASVRTWERYFSRARIIGVDINPQCKKFETDRITIEIGSQADGDLLRGITNRYPPTIVIDDGSHQADHILVTLEHLFPKILPGGCHVIEDLFFHSGVDAARKRGSATAAPQDHVSQIVHHMLDGNAPAKNLSDIGKKIVPHVDRIEVIRGAVLLWKKQPRSPNFDQWEELVKQSQSAANWDIYANYVVRNGGSMERAIAAANRAIELQPASAIRHERLSKIDERFGDLERATDAQKEAARIAPQREDVAARLNALQAAGAKAEGTTT